jgi:DNA-binding MarR family transcriptional regulator
MNPMSSSKAENTPAPAVTPEDVTQLLSYRVSVLSRQLARAGGSLYLKELGLTLPQWRTLSALGSFGELAVTGVAERTFMDRGQTSRTIDTLTRAGLIRLRPDVRDGRRTLYSLSADGERLYAAGLPLAKERQQRLVEALPPDDAACFSRVLDRLIGLTAKSSARKG